MRSPKVAAIVLNSVSHDTRVIKEAESLAKSGYNVTLIGIMDRRDSREINQLPYGTRVIRVHWQNELKKYAARVDFLLAMLGGVLSFCILFLLIWSYLTYYRLIVGLAQSMVNYVLNNIVVVCVHVIFLVLFCGGLYCLYKIWCYAKRKYHELQPLALLGRPPRKKSVLLSSWRQLKRRIVAKYAQRRAITGAMQAALQVIRPDIVHCHDLSTLPIGCKYKKKARCRLVYDSHEIFEETPFVHWLRKFAHVRAQRACSKYVDDFITINESIGQYLNGKYPRLPRAHIIMNATVPVLQPAAYDGRLHQAAALDPGYRIILYQGGFAPYRGLEVLVQAAAQLPEGWVVVMMGWGNLEATLQRIARTVDPEEKKVRFIPPVPQAELVYWTQGADVGVIPYENVCLNHWFCTPNKLWEYPSAGVPILASPFPEIIKIVRTYDLGWLLSDPVTSENLSQTIVRITANDLAQKKHNCATFIAQNDWTVYEQRLQEIYAPLTRPAIGQSQSEGRRSPIEV